MSPGPTDWRAWVAKADHDWLSVQNNLRGKRVPWDVVSFHAQQAADYIPCFSAAE